MEIDRGTKDQLLGQIGDAIEAGNPELSVSLVKTALASIAPTEILDVLQIRIKKVGTLFEDHILFLPELYSAALAMQACSDVLQPELVKLGTQKRQGKVVLGTVENDIHDIGKNIVGTVLKANGFEVFDIGVNCPADKFLDKAVEVQADIIAMSSLLTTTMPEIADIIEKLKGMKPRKPILTMVGGAPITQEFADRVGADGFSSDAFGAVKVASRLLSEKHA